MGYPIITLRAARVNAGLSLKEASRLIGISAATLRNYEVGKTSPTWENVERISRLYCVPPDYIFFGPNPRYKRESSKKA